MLVYDIFGLYPQTIQGASILAQKLECLVIIPDFFRGKAASMDWVAMDTEEKRNNMMTFFGENASPEKNLSTLLDIMKQSEDLYPQVKSWGVLGLCWGGKLAALASGGRSYFKVSGQAHPSLLDIADAKATNIPHICLSSPEEQADVLKEYEQAMRANVDVEFELYETMFHGWMGSRANMENEQNSKEFTRGYEQIADFFNVHL
ncbi:Dienelactone hydrolase [Penicillium roqueforti FM164]|uniref:Dienelactone hydrolase n=2 Tax=Penicillium roqueforti TaxID=5082 RepID=W6PWX1_PENRF|nr:Dienelactone hydrolase [Penicillium roqueforti FM164]